MLHVILLNKYPSRYRQTLKTVAAHTLSTHGSEVCSRLCCSFSLVLVRIMVPRIQSFDRGWCGYVVVWVWAGDLQSFHTQTDIYFECYAEYCRSWRGFPSEKPYENNTRCHINWLIIVGGFWSQRSEGYSSILTKRLHLVTQAAAWRLSILWDSDVAMICKHTKLQTSKFCLQETDIYII